MAQNCISLIFVHLHKCTKERQGASSCGFGVTGTLGALFLTIFVLLPHSNYCQRLSKLTQHVLVVLEQPAPPTAGKRPTAGKQIGKKTGKSSSK